MSTSGNAPLSTERRPDDVANRIMASIHEERLGPGSRLPAERFFAAHLGVSRPVIREALKRLEGRGVVEIRPKSGAYVCSTLPPPLRTGLQELAETHPKWLRDSEHVRRWLDHYFMPAILRNQTPALLGQLRECVATMERNSNTQHRAQFERHSKADIEFHRVLAKMTGNAVYLHLMDFLADLVLRDIRYSRRILDAEYGSLNVEAHLAIYWAIRKNNLEAALRAVNDHYKLAEDSRPAAQDRVTAVNSQAGSAYGMAKISPACAPPATTRRFAQMRR